MIIAIHQPNYLPWLGYFSKIFAADVFVFHDRVEFSKSSYTKRCLIRKEKTSAEKTWLSVPVAEHRSGTPIHQISIDSSRNWTQKHLHKISNTYAAAPCFEEMYPWLSERMHKVSAMSSLSAMNMYLIREVAGLLEINTEFRMSSSLPVDGKADQLNAAIVKALGGHMYLAGTGRKNYQENDGFADAGIEVRMQDFGAWLGVHPYAQGTGSFTGGLSVVDALMHLGPEKIRTMFRDFQEAQLK